MVKCKRIYEDVAADDGFRLLVDRLWPRGLNKSKAAIDLWLKDVAPSTALRQWFGHDPARYDEFRRRYQAELAHNTAFRELVAIAGREANVTLLYAASDNEHNHALVLQEYVCAHLENDAVPGARCAGKDSPG